MSGTEAENKSQMPQFIQAMYGTMLGVSFYKSNFFEKYKIDIDNGGFPIDKPVTFYLLLFCFTLLIAAHDWFYFHKNYDKQDKFWPYIPQVFSLFFLSQMFVVASNEKPYIEWFVYGFFYTIVNIVNKHAITNTIKTWRKYIMHILLIFIGGAVIYRNKDFDPCIWNGVNIVIWVFVCFIWWVDESPEPKNKFFKTIHKEGKNIFVDPPPKKTDNAIV
ncbi:hypothetical protein [Flavobacterium microcysteis]